MIPENPQTHQQTTSQSGEAATQFEFSFDDSCHAVFDDVESNVVNDYHKYINENPGILEEFRKEAARQIQSGKTHLRAKLLLEILRDKIGMETKGTFKINNTFSGCLARHVIMIDPSFKNFFELRSKTGDLHNGE